MKKIKKTIRPENVLFIEWFNNLPHAQRPGIKKIICDKCHTSPSTINNWLYGNSGIPRLTQEKLNELAQETIFPIERNGGVNEPAK